MTETGPLVLDRTILHRGYLTVERVRFRLNGEEISREVERHGDAVAVLPYDPARRCALLVQLPRAPVLLATGEAYLIEACAGMIGEDEEAVEAVRREAREELGVRLGDLEFVGRLWSSPGITTERQTLFIATYAAADRTGQGGGAADEQEAIIVLERSLAELADEADRGDIGDAKLMLLLQALRLRSPALFLD